MSLIDRQAGPNSRHPASAGTSDAWRRRVGDEAWCRLAGEIAGAFLDVGEADMAAAPRTTAPVSRARHVAMYLANTVFQVQLSDVGSAFGRDRTSVAYGIARIEDGRDDAAFDALLTRLERLAEACRAHVEAAYAAGRGEDA